MLATTPKVELHLHLDCSLSFNVVQRLEPRITRAQFEAEFIALPFAPVWPIFSPAPLAAFS